MVQNAQPVILNLGCGFTRYDGMVNVDSFECCKPDVLADLEKPLPWKDNSVDGILASHVFEHLDNWWGCFTECARILKPGAVIEIRVPDESSYTALTYRDHKNVFGVTSFHGTIGRTAYTNAWAYDQIESVPLKLTRYYRVPFPQYNWMPHWLIQFVGDHMRNFIWQQVFEFTKVAENYKEIRR